MRFEFDHLFIFTSLGGEKEVNRLATFGLTEGPPNVHPGQGTACRRFFFANSYLELLWICHAGEAQSDTSKPTHLWERWAKRASGASPFGLALRPRIQHEGVVPFSGFEYRPSYLPAPLGIHVATNANVLTEPMLFYLAFAQRPDSYPAARRPPLHHGAGLREATRVEFASPHADRLSSEVTAVVDTGLVGLCSGSEHLLEVGFDGEVRGQQADFRPLLPLLFRW